MAYVFKLRLKKIIFLTQSAEKFNFWALKWTFPHCYFTFVRCHSRRTAKLRSVKTKYQKWGFVWPPCNNEQGWRRRTNQVSCEQAPQQLSKRRRRSAQETRNRAPPLFSLLLLLLRNDIRVKGDIKRRGLGKLIYYTTRASSKFFSSFLSSGVRSSSCFSSFRSFFFCWVRQRAPNDSPNLTYWLKIDANVCALSTRQRCQFFAKTSSSSSSDLLTLVPVEPPS